MYKVKDEVTIIKTGEVKQIIDFETVCGVEVYYMSDKTAYPVDEITYLDGLVENTVEYEDGGNWFQGFMKSVITGEEFDRKMSVSEIKEYLIKDNPDMSIKTLRVFDNKKNGSSEFIINGEKYIFKTPFGDSFKVIPKNESFIKRAVRIFKDLKNNLVK